MSHVVRAQTRGKGNVVDNSHVDQECCGISAESPLNYEDTFSTIHLR